MRLVSASEDATRAMARALAAALAPGSRVLLYGDLGAGKTAFVRGLAEGLGLDADAVNSPTFTLRQEYRPAAGATTPTLHHVDLYRLAAGDAADLGLDDEDVRAGVLVIEWAERWPQAATDTAIVVRLWHGGGDVRVIDVDAPGASVRLPSAPEVWLRGALPDVPPALQPLVHALLQVHEDAARALAGLPAETVWRTPEGAASLGFHARHLVGSLDRLLTYARGASLQAEQLAYLKAEGTPGTPPPSAASLIEQVAEGIAAAIATIVATPERDWFEARQVGRAGLPTTVFGLLVHAAEHSARHAGQMITTARVVAPPTPPPPAPARSR